MVLSFLLIVLLGFIWAGGYAIANIVIKNNVNPYGYAFWQICGPIIFLSFIEVYRSFLSLKNFTLDLRWNIILYSMSAGFLGIALPNLIIYLSSYNLQSNILTILSNCSPIFIYLFALLFRIERFNFFKFLLVFIGVLGIILILSSKLNFISFSLDKWLLIAMIVPMCYALSTIIIARFKPKKSFNYNDINIYSLLMLICASFFIIPLTIINNGFYPLKLNDLNSILILVEILLSSIGYLLLYKIIDKVGPVYYTLVNAFTVIAGVFYGVVIFKDNLITMNYIATFLILIAICGLTWFQIKK